MRKLLKITGIIAIVLLVLILITLFCSLFPNVIAQQLSFLFGIPVGSKAVILIMEVFNNDR